MRPENKVKQAKLIHLERKDMTTLIKLSMDKGFSSPKQYIESLVAQEVQKYERKNQKD